MITPKEAEKRAHETVEAYVAAAGCRNENDVANVLMKLASMAGLAIAAAVGRDEALARMQGCVLNVAHATVESVPLAVFAVAGTNTPH